MRARRGGDDVPIWAPNPYALARLLLQRRWDGDNQALAEVFMVADWQLLFVPNENAPTILDVLLESKVQAQQYSSIEQAIATLPSSLSPAAQRTFEQVMRSSRGQELVGRLASVLLPGAVLDEEVLGAAAWTYRPAEGALFSGASFDDPMQGDWLNCYFIAALIAVAWSLPEDWNSRLAQASDQDGTLKWTFIQTGLDTTLSIAPDLPMHGAVPGGATSRSEQEFWPGILEKAFAKYCSTDLQDDIAGDYLPSMRQYSVMNRHESLRFPEEALSLLLGGIPEKEFSSQGKASFVAKLRNRLGTQPARRAVVASTRPSLGDHAKQVGLVARHAYAVLDVTAEDDLVILRDPYGQCPSGVVPADPPAQWRTVNEKDSGAVLDAKHGYLALSLDDFFKHFKSISFVRQPGRRKDK